MDHSPSHIASQDLDTSSPVSLGHTNMAALLCTHTLDRALNVRGEEEEEEKRGGGRGGEGGGGEGERGGGGEKMDKESNGRWEDVTKCPFTNMAYSFTDMLSAGKFLPTDTPTTPAFRATPSHLNTTSPTVTGRRDSLWTWRTSP